ncbi:MAG TPA: MauE/DoxX family redox-associated membrane protein [Actinocrinis sp.]|nr:MauE/DoxX family redox-associated membrane protein [Actinocrinis sp.]
MTAERGTAATNGKGGAAGAGGGKRATSKQAVPEPETEPKSAFATAAPWISLAARLLLGAMWLFYCLPKLGASDANAASVRNFKILPGAMVNTFAYAQPYVELALGLLVIVGLGTRLVAALSALLLLVYIGGIASLGIRGIHITCGCGGAGGQVAAGQTRYTLDILRDVLYLIPAVWLLWKPKSKFSADAALLPELTPVAPVPTPRRSAPAKGGSSRR